MQVKHGRKKLISEFWGGFWHATELSFCGQKATIGDYPEEFAKDSNLVTCKKCLKALTKC